MKKIILSLILSILLVGCISDKEQRFNNCNTPQTTIMGSDFNKEVYVWEGFIFKDNK